MKKQFKIILALFILIIISAIYPLINFYADKTNLDIPGHTTYEKALGKILPDSIKSKAISKKCKGNILPVKYVKGVTVDFPSIKLDVVAALSSYPKWNVRVEEQDKAEIKKHLEERFKKWGAFASPSIFEKMLSSQAHNEFNTKYTTSAILSEITQSKGDNLKLSLSVNNIVTGSLVFKVAVNFVHPKTLSMWELEKSNKLEEIASLNKKADFSFYVTKVLSGILVLFLLFISGQKVISKKRNRDYVKYLQSEIIKREELVDNGHFVAALELTEKYLKVFPNDTDVIAFKNRLLDFTNNDPQKAQSAFVEAKKLQARINMAIDDPMQNLLSLNEKEELKSLLPYNPNLKKNYLALVSAEEAIKEKEGLQKEIDEIKRLIKNGKLSEADEALNLLLEDEANSSEMNKLSEKLNNKKETAKELWERLVQELRSNQNVQLEERLKDILKIWQDMFDAKRLADGLKLGKNKTKFKIKTEEREVQIHCGSKFILGREDDDVAPDIVLNDKRVSRPHAKITFEDIGVVIEDLNSSGGTYVNGETILNKVLRNNDTLTLAKVLDFTTFVYRENNSCIMLRNDSTDIVLLNGTVEFEIVNEKIKLGNSGNLLRYSNGLLLLLDDNNITIFFDGQEFLFNDTNYRVEELK